MNEPASGGGSVFTTVRGRWATRVPVARGLDQLGGSQLLVRSLRGAARDTKLGSEIVPCAHQPPALHPRWPRSALSDLHRQRNLCPAVQTQVQRLAHRVLGTFFWPTFLAGDLDAAERYGEMLFETATMARACVAPYQGRVVVEGDATSILFVGGTCFSERPEIGEAAGRAF
jgi:hypothetical protein